MTNSPYQSDKTIQYFVPGELLFFFQSESENPLSIDKIVDLLRADELFHAVKHEREPEVNMERVRLFRPDNIHYVLVPVSTTLDTKQLIETVNSYDKLLMKSKKTRRRLPARLEAVTPNWFGGGAPSQIGTGGPGAKPIPYPVPLVSGSPQGQQGHLSTPPNTFTIPSHIQQRLAENQANRSSDPAIVAVLDTAPSQAALTHAVGMFPENKLLAAVEQRLKGHIDHSSMSYFPSALAHDHFCICGHDYDMIDHGLFVSGIIGSLAPEAELHLIQVLDEYGIGTVETIFAGLVQALELQRNEQRPLIINMSLTLSVPRKGHDTTDLPWKRLKSSANYAARLASPLQIICDEFSRDNTVLVAAAGNDSGVSDCANIPNRKSFSAAGRLPARFPAAFKSVIGVAALLKDSDTPASYSNKADDPTNNGFAVFGGGKSANGDAMEGASILGLYCGAFPNSPTNSSGWAWWSGTSFATPILSGILASLCGAGMSVPSAIQVARNVQSDDTSIGEEILSVTQS